MLSNQRRWIRRSIELVCVFLFLGLVGACQSEAVLPTRAVLAATLTPSVVAATDEIVVPPTPILPDPVTARPSPISATALPVTNTPVPTILPMATAVAQATICPPVEIITGTYESAIAGTSKYRVYLPPCYGSDGRSYPTLYMLPGNIQDDSAWDNYGLDEAAELAIQAGDVPPMIIVMLDGGWIANNTSSGPNSYEGVIMDEAIPFMEATYCVWPTAVGRAIGGISRGGYWSLMIAFRQPDQFVSVGGHSAALLDSHAGPDANPQFTGLNNDLGDLRIYMDMGEDDYVAANARRLHEDMVDEGIPHTGVINEGEHEDSYWPQHVAEYIAWYGEAWSLDRQDYPFCLPSNE